jgi:hypothetical protein
LLDLANDLSGCLALRDQSRHEAITFVCSDRWLCRAAAGEDFAVFDPEAEG